LGAQRARFEKDLQPLFQARCVSCHGGGAPAAGLRLQAMSDVLKGGTNGPVIIEGFSERSLLVRRVANHTMPPKGAGQALSEQDVRTIREWIDRGNFAESVAMDSAERPFTPLEAPSITVEQKKHWAFQPPVASAAPKVKARARVRTPIDRFVLAKLEAKGLRYSPDATDLQLMRRAFLDLTGLPPTLDEIETFTRDTKPGAYERLIDRLLDSPHYGERWGRQWLDAAGYVDTTGKDFDPSKTEYAEGLWRYRDYVIRAFNSDKPWDRFLTEQLAGDELVDWRRADKYTPDITELLAATGYLRTILDITHEDISNLPVERYEALFKLVEKVSSSTLGLTVGCARCHSHKFDPIPQRDYYRFLSLFTTAYNPADWIQPQNRHLYTVSNADKEKIDAHNKAIDEPIAALKKEIADVRKPFEKKLVEERLAAKVPEGLRDDVRSAIETPAEKRDEVQKYLFGKFNPLVRVVAKDLEPLVSTAKLDAEVAALEAKKQKLEKIQAMWDVGAVPSIRLLQRGNPDAPGPRVKPGFLEVLGGPLDAVKPKEAVGETSGIRLAFAQWLTRPDHPLTARVIVNRIWQGHFGTGIVATPDNFGTMGAAPSNQELLNYLAADFVANGWKAKRLHKLIMMSTAYRQASRQSEQARALDPDNLLLWRMNLQRLDAESLRDSIMSVSGKLDKTAFGPPIPLEMRPDGLQVVSTKVAESEQWRRSIYVTSRRTYPLSFLGVFDHPAIDTNCTRRVPSATPLQSLTLMNDDFMWKAAAALAERAAGDVEKAYLLALSRRPSADELAMAAAFLQTGKFPDFARALLSSNEFLYID
jgi:hypothetical protein